MRVERVPCGLRSALRRCMDKCTLIEWMVANSSVVMSVSRTVDGGAGNAHAAWINIRIWYPSQDAGSPGMKPDCSDWRAGHTVAFALCVKRSGRAGLTAVATALGYRQYLWLMPTCSRISGEQRREKKVLPVIKVLLTISLIIVFHQDCTCRG